ncbi:hypothetical protein QBC38DRAFT_483440 [Podospora fimiseda]|uniref:Rhodopsin domain-containing protein n=1 Tax=Podospora fimiseda TaxID=252190 RepID=A0AAN7BL73_9PEZI|nr:hypothetical protein QBC38DRAFT_483440 [Podospora fimiseda]
MTLEHNGRISKDVYLGTSGAFFAISIIACLVRFYIRIFHIREFGWDDGILLAGLITLIIGVSILFIITDVMYESDAFVFWDSPESPLAAIGDIGKFLDKTFWYRRLSAVGLTFCWLSICCVKFSFLAFFKRLIRQMPAMIRYWWFTVVYNFIVMLYGCATYWAACPYFDTKYALKIVECVDGPGLRLATAWAGAQMALDLAGDLFILVIPCILIYQIRVRLTQKIALGFTLCLTIVMVILTVVRIAGLQYKGKLDSIWETYFILVPAEIGLTLVAATAFRALYISKSKNRKHSHDTITTFNWYTRAKSSLKHMVGRVTGKSSNNSNGSAAFEHIDMGNGQFIKQEIPRGTITGVQTFIDKNGRTVYMTNKQVTQNTTTLSTMYSTDTTVYDRDGQSV